MTIVAKAFVCVLTASVLTGCGTAHSPSAASQTWTTIAKLPNPTYEFASDGGRQGMWLVVPTSDKTGRLDFVNAAGKIDSFALPPGPVSFLASHVRLAPDGSVWISFDYRALRFDAGSSQFVEYDFAEPVSDGTAVAPEVSPWISAIAFDSKSNAYLAHNDTGSVDIVSPEMKLVGHRVLPPGFEHVMDMTLTPAGVQVVREGHAEAETLPVATLGAEAPDQAGGALRGHAGPAQYLFLTDARGTRASWDREAGVITWYSGSGPSHIQLPEISGATAVVPPGPDGQPAVPRTALRGHAAVDALGLDAQGNLWLAVQLDGSESLLLIKP